MKNYSIDFEKVPSFLEKLMLTDFILENQPEKQKILIYHQDEKIADFRLPLPLKNIDTTLTEYLQYFPQEMPNYVIYMIQAGHCAMAYVEEGQVIEHKTIKTYMVRKKQGKNQLKHLESKGKSKAGSRIRLTNTVHFFEDINERLQYYFEDYFIEKIIYSCPINMLSLFYESKIKTPFDKKDSRLIKIPKDVQQPSYEELLHINTEICKGELSIYNDSFAEELTQLL